MKRFLAFRGDRLILITEDSTVDLSEVRYRMLCKNFSCISESIIESIDKLSLIFCNTDPYA